MKVQFHMEVYKEMDIKDRLRYELEYNSKQWWIDVTDLVKEILGDIVEKAEVSDFYDYTEDEAIEATKIFMIKQEERIKDGLGINFDGENMRITFVNGKQIEIWNSEWGGIRAPEIGK